jgi:hypothetical protein
MWSVGGSGVANAAPLPFNKGFNIEIPGSTTQTVYFTGLVPTNTTTYPIGPGASGSTGETYYVRSVNLPRRTLMSESGLKPILTGGISVLFADEVRILSNTQGLGSKTSPKARIWLRSTDNTFRFTPGNASAESYELLPGDAVIIVRRNTGNVTATNAPTYTPPTRTMTP